MIDLDPLCRLGIVLSAFAVVPLLLVAEWAVRKASDTQWTSGPREIRR